MFVISISRRRCGRQHDCSCWFRMMKTIRSRMIAVILGGVRIPTYCLHKASHLLSSPRSWRSACTWRAALPEVGFSSLPLPSQLLVSQSQSPFPRSYIVGRFEKWEELLISSTMGKIGGTANLLPRLETLQISNKCELGQDWKVSQVKIPLDIEVAPPTT